MDQKGRHRRTRAKRSGQEDVPTSEMRLHQDAKANADARSLSNVRRSWQRKRRIQSCQWHSPIPSCRRS